MIQKSNTTKRYNLENFFLIYLPNPNFQSPLNRQIIIYFMHLPTCSSMNIVLFSFLNTMSSPLDMLFCTLRFFIKHEILEFISVNKVLPHSSLQLLVFY